MGASGDELRELASLSWPIVLGNLLAYVLQNESAVFVGHLGAAPLAAAALGNTFFNIVYYAVLGASTALDTLASQAYGAGNTTLVRLWTMRTALMLTIFYIPCAVLMWFSGDIMTVVFGLDPELCRDAAVFVKWTIPGGYFYSLFLCLQKFQQCQGVMSPAVLAALAANFTNIALQYTVVDVLGLGLAGSAGATSLSRLVMVVTLAAHVFCTPPPPPPRRPPGAPVLDQTVESLHPVAELAIVDSAALKLLSRMGLAGAAMLILEAWMFEASTVAAGRLGDVPLDAHNVLLLLCGLCFTSIPFGISIAATIRIGNLLGAGCSDQARLAAKLCIGCGAGFMVLCGAAEFACRKDLGLLFTDDDRVVKLVARLTPIGALFAVADGFQGVCGGVFRGLGRQGTIARMNLVGFWFVGVPASFYLCSVAEGMSFSRGPGFYGPRLGIFGLWWGLCAGLFLISAMYVVLWAGVEWEHEAEKAYSLSRIGGIGGGSAESSKLLQGRRGSGTGSNAYGTVL